VASTDLSDAIAENAQSPQSATTDAGSVTSVPVADQIAADQYLATKAAARTRRRGLRFNKIRLGGQVPGVCPGGSDPPC
jgi:hypothetical protein